MNRTWRQMAALTGSVLLAAACAAQESNGTGAIVGTVSQPDAVAAVSAVNRDTGKRFPGRIEAAAGGFIVDNLPPEADYDCVFDCKSGARLEGVNLKVPPSEYVEEQPLSSADIETIRAKVLSMDKFENQVDILCITGNVQHAAILMNKLRAGGFYNSKAGEVIWRAEIVHFERPEETWTKVGDQLYVLLYRERIQKSVYEKKSVTFDPRLGGIRVPPGPEPANVGRVVLPAAAPGIRLRGDAETR